MKTKFHLKYILFAILIMFICIPNVGAIKYTVCTYGNINSKSDFKKTRIIFQNDKYLTYGAKLGQTWQGSAKMFTTKSASNAYYNCNNNENARCDTSYENSQITTSTTEKTCYDKIFANRVYNDTVLETQEFSKRSSESFSTSIQDITCWYQNIEDSSNQYIYKYTLPGTFYGSNTMLIKDKGEENRDKTLVSYLPVAETDVDAINYTDISKNYYYLKHASEEGCPTALAVSDKYFYVAYKVIDQNVIKSADKPGNSSFKGGKSSYEGYKLVCNRDMIDRVNNQLQKIVDDDNKYIPQWDAYSDEEWNQQKLRCEKDRSCKCKQTDTVQDYRFCTIKIFYEKIDNDIKSLDKQTEENKNSLAKVGCGEEAKQLGEAHKEELLKIADQANNLVKKWSENGKLTTEQAKELGIIVGNMEESINGLIDRFFNINNTKLSGVGNNNLVDCNAIFGQACDKDKLSLMCFITTIFDILRYLIPAILIILGSIDFSKVVISNDKEAMSKAVSTFVMRAIIALVIFLLPLLINFLLQIFNTSYSTEDKINCVIESLTGGSND